MTFQVFQKHDALTTLWLFFVNYAHLLVIIECQICLLMLAPSRKFYPLGFSTTFEISGFVEVVFVAILHEFVFYLGYQEKTLIVFSVYGHISSLLWPLRAESEHQGRVL